MYVSMYICRERRVYTLVRTYTYIYIHTYVCMCMYIYIYTYTHLHIKLWVSLASSRAAHN